MSDVEDVKGAVGGVDNEEKTDENPSRKEDGNGDPGRSDGGSRRGYRGRGRGDWKPRGGGRGGGNFVEKSQGGSEGGWNTRGGRGSDWNWKPRGGRGQGQSGESRYFYGPRFGNRASNENAVETRDIVTTDDGWESAPLAPKKDTNTTVVGAKSGEKQATPRDDEEPGPSKRLMALPMKNVPEAFNHAFKKMTNELLTAAERKTYGESGSTPLAPKKERYTTVVAHSCKKQMTQREDDEPSKRLVAPPMKTVPNDFDDVSKNLMNELLTVAEGKTEWEMGTLVEALDVFKVSLRNLAADYCESLEATNRRTKDQIRSDCSTTVRWVKQSLRNVLAASLSKGDPTDLQTLFCAEPDLTDLQKLFRDEDDPTGLQRLFGEDDPQKIFGAEDE